MTKLFLFNDKFDLYPVISFSALHARLSMVSDLNQEKLNQSVQIHSEIFCLAYNVSASTNALCGWMKLHIEYSENGWNRFPAWRDLFHLPSIVCHGLCPNMLKMEQDFVSSDVTTQNVLCVCLLGQNSFVSLLFCPGSSCWKLAVNIFAWKAKRQKSRKRNKSELFLPPLLPLPFPPQTPAHEREMIWRVFAKRPKSEKMALISLRASKLWLPSPRLSSPWMVGFANRAPP